MIYYLAMMEFVFVLLALFLGWQTWRYFRRLRLQKKIESEAFPESYRRWLERIPQYRLLPPELKERLEKKILYFMATREFRGVKTEVTEEMRVVISFFACLMVLEIPGECYEALKTILIYPSDVVAEEVRSNGGIYSRERLILEGQSAGDTVVIAWNEARREAYHLRRHNVVVHELAHVLDFEEGAFDGTPPLEWSRYDEWAHVLYRRFRVLQEKAHTNRDWGKYALIGEYAASNEAEFFAVVSELYFQAPLTLKRHFPDLYKEWKSFFGLDTASLFTEAESRSGRSIRAH